ncbi:hypothetical protein GCM10020369_66360 [Cryptosporangium minutisporangium]|uniref:Uncharacterized protein n=1 Tax=Cryptosporangium minutisporangium TaxID=113569 RepID=A0ABP6T7Y8_9ACTN
MFDSSVLVPITIYLGVVVGLTVLLLLSVGVGETVSWIRHRQPAVRPAAHRPRLPRGIAHRGTPITH